MHERTGSPPGLILLATFQGERFLSEQLESILDQSERSFRILVRDDGSTDRTVSILHEFASHSRERIRIIENGEGRLGACGNFDRLLSRADGEYVAFADQDDRWDRDKLETLLRTLRELERLHGAATPILVHGDLRVTDDRLRPIATSLWRYQKLDPVRGAALPRLLGQNVVTGSASMANRALVERARPIPEEAVMHDWWLALVAAAFGVLHPVTRAVGDYRQHGANEIGAKRWGSSYVFRKLVEIADRHELRSILERTAAQAMAFERRYGATLDTTARAVVADYAGLPSQGFWERRRTLVRRGFWRCGWLRNAGLLVRL